MYTIIGSSGFIGRHLSAKLGKCYKVDRVFATHDKLGEAYLIDIAKPQPAPEALDTLDEIIKRSEGVFFLAGNADWRYCEANRAAVTDEILRGVINVAELCAKHQVPVVYASTGMVYGSRLSGEIRETSPKSPDTAYGVMKLLAEHTLCNYADKKGLKLGIARFFNVYGPHQDEAVTYKSAVIPDYIKALLAETDEPFTVYNPGAWRDFVYVSDVCDALLRLMLHARIGTRFINENDDYAFNVASGDSTVIAMLMLCLGNQIGMRRALKVSGSIREPSFHVSINKLLQLGPTGSMSASFWRPEVKLEVGLAKTVQAYKEKISATA